MLFFVSCNTELFDTVDIDLENVPAFVELTAHPVSQAFFSAVALRMREKAANGGFSKVMALINELINDNRRQIQRIRKINERVEGECLITTHKLKDRAIFFNGQRSYFNTRSTVSVEEKAEALNVMNSRNTQKTVYANLLNTANSAFQLQDKKWGARIQRAQDALSKVNAALGAINEWTPKTNPAFIQRLVKETTELYSKVKRYPLSIPSEMIQLAANDNQLKKRLYEWLNLLKGSVVEALGSAQTARNEITSLYNSYRNTLQTLNDLLLDDSKKLANAIENYSTLIKVYTENEKIYTNLASQNDLLIVANTKWCDQEMANYKANHNAMVAQLKVFTDLKFWLRKNFSRVKEWLQKKYAK